MKKLLLSLILIVSTTSIAIAQDLDQLITDLAKMEGVQHQLVDKTMLDKQLEDAKAADSTGELASKIPAFMEKIDQIEVVMAQSAPAEIKDKITTQLADFKDENGYESLLKVKQGEQDIRIIAKKGKEKSDIFVIVIAGEAIIAVKMTGDLNEQDFIDIVKEQQKQQEQQPQE